MMVWGLARTNIGGEFLLPYNKGLSKLAVIVLIKEVYHRV